MQELSNRYRISSDFVLQKIGIGFGLFMVILYWGNDVIHLHFTEQTGALLIATLLLSLLLYYVSRAKKVEYDDIQCRVYLVKANGDSDTEIPVERIDKILYSSFPGRGSHSYVIVYHEEFGEAKKFRLFPRFFSNDVTRLINDTRARNPNLITRNWSFGINELFD